MSASRKQILTRVVLIVIGIVVLIGVVIGVSLYGPKGHTSFSGYASKQIQFNEIAEQVTKDALQLVNTDNAEIEKPSEEIPDSDDLPGGCATNNKQDIFGDKKTGHTAEARVNVIYKDLEEIDDLGNVTTVDDSVAHLENATAVYNAIKSKFKSSGIKIIRSYKRKDLFNISQGIDAKSKSGDYVGLSLSQSIEPGTSEGAVHQIVVTFSIGSDVCYTH